MRLVYFTDSYPYGIGEVWKENELEIFKNFFHPIFVIPFHCAGNMSHPQILPEGIIGHPPLFPEFKPSLSQQLCSLTNPRIIYYLREAYERNIFTNRIWFKSWLLGVAKTERLLRHPTIMQFFREDLLETIFYFFWGEGSAYIIPFLRRKNIGGIFVRFHRYDLYEYANNGYLPFLPAILQSATYALPCSTDGVTYLRNRFPKISFRAIEARLGTISSGIASPSDGKNLHIVSCSTVSPVKRVHLIAEALSLIPFPVVWTHIGSGPLFEELKHKVELLPSHIKVNLLGFVPARKVAHTYSSGIFDLFLNVSKSEGVPVAIMEALAAGIPVWATRVGGTAEIIDEQVGGLFDRDITPNEIAQFLTSFFEMSSEHKLLLRREAYHRFLKRSQAQNLASKLAQLMINVCNIKQ